MTTHAPLSHSGLVTKVGAVILRLHAGVPQVLVAQPKPKPGAQEAKPPGLVRGTRKYHLPDGTHTDADHDGRTPPPEGAELEPLFATLQSEIEEEAGVPPEMLQAAEVYEMGARVFPSRTKTPYPIFWYVMMLNDALQAQLAHEGMQDSLYTQWMTLADMQALVEAGIMTAGYLDIAREGIAYYDAQTRP